MIGVIQRVKEAEVLVEGKSVAKIGNGILLLAGIAHDDSPNDIIFMAGKVANLRIFSDQNGLMNHSLLETGGEILVVSQFTLLGDTRKGRRPNFTCAAQAQKAKNLYSLLVSELKKYIKVVKEGIFGAIMDVRLVNDGPVTLIIDSRK